MRGGSVSIYLFAEIFKGRVIGLPVVNQDDSPHAVNEDLRPQTLWDAVETYAAMTVVLDWQVLHRN